MPPIRPEQLGVALFSSFMLAGAYFGSLNPYSLGLTSSVAVSTIVFILASIIARIFSKHRFLKILALSSLIVFCCLVTISNWFYYEYFGVWLSRDILFMGSDVAAGLDALDPSKHLTASIMLVGISIVSISLIAVSRAPLAPIRNTTFIFATFLAVSTLVAAELSLATYRERGGTWLLPSNLHPVHAFFHSSASQQEFDEEELAAIQQFGSRNTPASDATLRDQFASGKNTKHNVIMLALESFRADMTGVYGGRNFTPNFDEISTHGLLARQHFSNTTHTVSAEINMWCGLYDSRGERKLAYIADSKKLSACLPKVLSDLGYKTKYFHGNSGKFYNREKLLPKLGFEHAYYYKDEHANVPTGDKVGWGVSDVIMFQHLFDQASSTDRKRPFFYHFTSISNHFPFTWDVPDSDFSVPFSRSDGENSLMQNYQNMIAYTDFALGKFWESFINSSLAENTILVITSDHGIWRFEDDTAPLIERNEKFFRAPLFIYHPQGALNAEYNDVSSHIDIPETILSLLGVPAPVSMIGRDLTRKYTSENRVIADRNLDTVYRSRSFACIAGNDECEMQQLECAAPSGDLLHLSEIANQKLCYKLTGDILLGGSWTSDESRLNEYNVARSYRAYHDSLDDR